MFCEMQHTAHFKNIFIINSQFPDEWSTKRMKYFIGKTFRAFVENIRFTSSKSKKKHTTAYTYSRIKNNKLKHKKRILYETDLNDRAVYV